MRSLLQFFIKRGTFLLFLLLEVLSFVFVFRFSAFHQSGLFSFSNRVVGGMYEKMSAISDYFALTEKNQVLNAENASLRQYIYLLEQGGLDSLSHSVVATDRQYSVYPAKVIYLTTNRKNNYLLLDKGILSGLNANMAVVSKDGVVGVITYSNEHYSVCIPLINSEIKVSCRIKNDDYTGVVAWDGADCKLAHMYDVPTHVSISVGDTIVTSGLSSTFPPDLPVGIVQKAQAAKSNVYYDIDVRLFTDFSRLSYVNVISNQNHDEEEEIKHSFMK